MKKDALVNALNKTMTWLTSDKHSYLNSNIVKAEDELNKRNGNETDAPYETETLKKDIGDLMMTNAEGEVDFHVALGASGRAL